GDVEGTGEERSDGFRPGVERLDVERDLRAEILREDALRESVDRRRVREVGEVPEVERHRCGGGRRRPGRLSGRRFGARGREKEDDDGQTFHGERPFIDRNSGDSYVSRAGRQVT